MVLVLAACGFRPLYQQDSAGDSVPQMAQVAVAYDDNRLSQLVRNNLRIRLTPRGTPGAAKYQLLLAIAESQSATLVTRQETITRNNMVVNAGYRLVDIASGEILLEGDAKSVASYNLLRSDYATLVAEEDARERAALDLAEQIRTRLAIYFTSTTGP